MKKHVHRCDALITCMTVLSIKARYRDGMFVCVCVTFKWCSDVCIPSEAWRAGASSSCAASSHTCSCVHFATHTHAHTQVPQRHAAAVQTQQEGRQPDCLTDDFSPSPYHHHHHLSLCLYWSVVTNNCCSYLNQLFALVILSYTDTQIQRYQTGASTLFWRGSCYSNAQVPTCEC